MKVVDDRHKNHKTNDSTVERGRLRQCICSYSYPINFCNDIVRVSSSSLTPCLQTRYSRVISGQNKLL